MVNKIFFIVIYIVSIESRTIRDDNCRISIAYKNGDIKEPQPLILLKNKVSTNFLYPNDKEGYINVPHLEKINLACPGKNNYILGIKGLINNPSEIQVQCIRQKTFRVNNNSNNKRNNPILFNITNVECKRLPRTESHSMSEKCFNNSTSIELGFRLKNEFLRTIELCRDNINYSTYYTKYKLTGKIEYQQLGYPRPGTWLSGEFPTKFDMDYLYKLSTQLKAIANIVGSEKLANKYLIPGTSSFLARGHLVAKADFIYGNEQRSTFWYMNSAPQWQSFNGGNWNTLEINVRKFAGRNLLNLDVYTGVHGQMKLIDINGNAAPLYLYVNGTDKQLPVPQYYWKIIYDPVRKLGTAFVGLNDPFALEITNEMYICKNIANKITWLNWNADKIHKGVSYACNINDIRKVIPGIPELEVYGILM